MRLPPSSVIANDDDDDDDDDYHALVLMLEINDGFFLARFQDFQPEPNEILVLCLFPKQFAL